MCPGTLLTDPMNATDGQVRAAGEAALAAGFTEGSVWQHQLDAISGAGLGIGVIEAATVWANGEAGDADAEARRLAALVRQYGAGRVLAACLDATIDDIDRTRRNLASLVDTLGEQGAQLCLEFLPWSGVPDLATAWSLLGPLGPSATLVLDTWHWVRQPGGPAFELLATIPGERIGYVQLCDVAPTQEGDLMTEAMTNRLLPGEGVVDFAALFASLDSIGASPYLATEVFNPSLVARLGAVDAANAMKAAAERVMPHA